MVKAEGGHATSTPATALDVHAHEPAVRRCVAHSGYLAEHRKMNEGIKGINGNPDSQFVTKEAIWPVQTLTYGFVLVACLKSRPQSQASMPHSGQRCRGVVHWSTER